MLVAIRITAQAQLDRIELERNRELVHRAFERIDPGRGARRAHVAGGGKIELRDLMRILRVGALVEEARPAGLLPVKILVLRGQRDGIVGDRLERAGTRSADLDALDHARPVTDLIHLLPAQHEPHRALERARREHREDHLVLRAQARAEPASHIRPDDANVLRLHLEHACDVALHVLHALRLVVDGEFAVPPVDHRGGIELHRIVMLHWDVILGFVAHLGCGECLPRFAARLRRAERRRLRLQGDGGIALLMEVGDVRLLLVFDAHQGGGKARDLPLLGDDQRDRLVVEADLVIVERAKRRSVRRDLVLVGLIALCHARPVLVREHVEYAFDAQRLARIDVLDAPFGDARRDDGGMRQPLRVVFARIFRRARDFRAAVDAGRWRADIGHGLAHRIFLSDCDCGVPCAACARARTMPRRASSILKELCA